MSTKYEQGARAESCALGAACNINDDQRGGGETYLSGLMAPRADTVLGLDPDPGRAGATDRGAGDEASSAPQQQRMDDLPDILADAAARMG